MTETEKKGVDYINKRIAEGQTNISEMIAELLEQIENMYTEEQVKECIRGACRDGHKGYDEYDLLISDYI